MRLSALVLGCVVLTLASPAHAQSAGGPSFGSVAGAVLGGAGGLVGGGLLGAAMTSSDCEEGNPDACLGEAIPGFLWGAGIGMTVGVPVGAHVGSGRQGNLGRSLLVSAGLFAVEALVLSQLSDNGRTEHIGTVQAIAIGVPVLQIISSVWIESN